MNYVENNRLTPKERHFFSTLSSYLQKPLFFFGSVQRFDYLKGMSDIDVAIFTDNIPSTLKKLQLFLNYSKPIDKFIYRNKLSRSVIYGNKLMYKTPTNDIITELSIYNIKDKKVILQDQLSKINVPIFVSVLLLILKFLYSLNLVSSKDSKYWKHRILHMVPHASGEAVFIKL